MRVLLFVIDRLIDKSVYFVRTIHYIRLALGDKVL